MDNSRNNRMKLDWPLNQYHECLNHSFGPVDPYNGKQEVKTKNIIFFIFIFTKTY